MVWWTKYGTNYSRSSPYCNCEQVEEEVPGDRIFQTINIMFNFHNKIYNAHEIHSLVMSGVNIFNVDFTFFDEKFFKEVKTALTEAEELPKMFKSQYYRPIGLSVTMSVNHPVDIDERVDIIILKEVTKAEQLFEYRKQNSKSFLIPILLWFTTCKGTEENELISVSDGIVMDLRNTDNVIDEFFPYPLHICKKLQKTVFLLSSNIMKDYHRTGSNRQVLVVASHIVKNRFDGVVLNDYNKSEITSNELIQSLVKAFEFHEAEIEEDQDYYKLSLEIKIPVLPPLCVALAASLAALNCAAKAIIVLSASGRSARWIAFAAPPCQIIVVTARLSSARKLHLYRKVIPLFYERPRARNWQEECSNRVSFGTAFALHIGLFRSGAKLVVLAPSEEGVGYCNAFQIVTVPYRCEK